MTHDEAEAFFTFAMTRWPKASVFRFFARRPRDGAIYAETLDTPEALVRVTEWADKHGYNSYWMPNPTNVRGRIRARSADITHWQWLMVDIDPVDPSHADPEACAVRIHGLLADYFNERLPVPLRVDSGRGHQSLYPIHPYDLNQGVIERVDGYASGQMPLVSVVTTPSRTFMPQVASYWLNCLRRHLGPDNAYAGCTIDTSCSDLPRLMRIPYTINVKTGRRADVLGWPSTRTFDALDLSAPVPMVKPENVPVIAAKRWTDFVPHMTVAGRRFLLEGQEEPGRHRQAAAAMLSMIDLGATKEQVLAALLYGAKHCTPELEAKEIFDMVERRFR